MPPFFRTANHPPRPGLPWALVLGALLALGAASPPPAAPGPAVPAPATAAPEALVLDVLGPALVLADGVWRPAEAGAALLPDQHLYTGPGATVWLAVGKGTAVTVQPNSLIAYRLLRDTPLIGLLSGWMQVQVHDRWPLAVMAKGYYFPRLPSGRMVLGETTVTWQGPPGTRAFVLQEGRLVTIPPGKTHKFREDANVARLEPMAPAVPPPTPVPEASPSASASPEPLAVPFPSTAPSAPVPAVQSGRGGARPFTFQLRSNSSYDYTSNVEENPTGTSGTAFHQTLTGGVRYRFTEGGAQFILNYSHQIIAYLNRSDGYSFGVATAMVDVPIFEHADIYAGGMRIFKWIRNAPTSADSNWFVGGNGFWYPNAASLLYGGYQFGNLMTDNPATSYYGHTLQVGFRRSVTERLLMSVNYSFQLRSAVLQAQQTTRHSLGLEATYLFLKNVGLTLSTRYVIIGLPSGPGAQVFSLAPSLDLSW